MNPHIKHVHFLGICGAGASAAAVLAKHHGFEVSGCDSNGSNAKLGQHGIPVASSHAASHLEQCDWVAASPALTNAKSQHPEVVAARNKGILSSWQRFFGDNIRPKYKRLISIAGTHGKTSTTALLAQILASAGMDPTVLVGGTVIDWNANYRIGSENLLVWEADEYDGNFLSHRPDVVLLLNAEWEHPERYASEDEYFDMFKKFLSTIAYEGTLIANMEDPGVLKIIDAVNPILKGNNVSVTSIPPLDFNVIYESSGIRLGCSTPVSLGIFGEHNVGNLAAAIAVACLLEADIPSGLGLVRYSGVERRLQLKFDNHGITIYDDYGHHPSEIRATIEALRLHNPNKKIIAVVEPHQVSRLAQFGEDLACALSLADISLITKVFMGREAHLSLPNIVEIIKAVTNEHAEYIDSFEATVDSLIKLIQPNSCVVVFGAGHSLKLTELLIAKIQRSLSPA